MDIDGFDICQATSCEYCEAIPGVHMDTVEVNRLSIGGETDLAGGRSVLVYLNGKITGRGALERKTQIEGLRSICTFIFDGDRPQSGNRGCDAGNTSCCGGP